MSISSSGTEQNPPAQSASGASGESANPIAVPARRRSGRRLVRSVVGGLLGMAVAAGLVFAAGELSGWRALASPAERWLSRNLGHAVVISQDSGDFRLSLWGGIRLQARQFRIEAPAWSGQSPLLQADSVDIKARWRDLIWRDPQQALKLQQMGAQRLDIHLVRDASGRASWAREWEAPGQANDAAAESSPPRLPLDPGVVMARNGSLRWQDAPMQLDATVRFALVDVREPVTAPRVGASAGAAQPWTAASAVSAFGANAPAAAGVALQHLGLVAQAEGRYRDRPLSGWLRSGALAPWLAGGTASLNAAVPLALQLQAGRARLAFDGALADPMGRMDLNGTYTLSGPSLAAVGQPVGVTLPTTAAFSMRGRLAKQATVWNVLVDDASIGRSRLDGALRFDAAAARRRLDGRVHARSLALADLAPAIGAPTPQSPAAPRAPGRVLPDRPFDLPSLGAMDANVLLRFDRVDLGTPALQDVAPLHAHLVLEQGVLTINDLDARLAQGRLTGKASLDGRSSPARWTTALRASGLRLEQWVRAVQRPGQTAYATGRIGARIDLAGSGRSTAELLASADGRVLLHWTRGTLSHLAIEAAGLDLAQSLGVLLRGDDNLQVSCGIADLSLRDGLVKPQVMVVDTSDSRLWVEGQVSLSTERLALVARVQPKDFSPLALRAPLHIAGTLGAPSLSLDKPALARRAVPAALLALAHPLAALLPLIDVGQADETQGCAELSGRLKAGASP